MLHIIRCTAYTLLCPIIGVKTGSGGTNCDAGVRGGISVVEVRIVPGAFYY